MGHMPVDFMKQVHVEDDFYVFGFGGITTIPRGWGLDVAYINRAELRWPWGRAAIADRLIKKLRQQRRNHYLRNLFIRQMNGSFTRTISHEWHYRRAEQMYLLGKDRFPTLHRFGSFAEFIKEVMGGRDFVFPHELEQLVITALGRMGPEDMEKAIERQRYAIAHDLRMAIRLKLHGLLGDLVGEQLFNQLEASFPQDAGMYGDLEQFRRETFLSPAALQTLGAWHDRYFDWLETQQLGITSALEKLPAMALSSKPVRAAIKSTKTGLGSLPAPVLQLLKAMDVPVFIATSPDLRAFHHYHEPGFLVHRSDGAMHQKVGFGLCVYLPESHGGIFVAHQSARAEERFWHTLMEECTHFADGPVDRDNLRGMHRYSSAAVFHRAYEEDKQANGFWHRSGVLGEKEWAQFLNQRGMKDAQVQKILNAIRAYEATLDFEHYQPEKRAAEVFAALPIIERAVGGKLAREVLHHMFQYYDFVYQPALTEEAKIHHI